MADFEPGATAAAAAMVEAQQEQHTHDGELLVRLQLDLQDALMQPAAQHSAAEPAPRLVATLTAVEPSAAAAAEPADSAAAARAGGASTPRLPSRCASEPCLSGCEEDWIHVASRGSSVAAPSSAGGRDSLDLSACAAPSPPASCCGSDATPTPKDELAASILGHSVLMAAAQQAASMGGAAAEGAAASSPADAEAAAAGPPAAVEGAAAAAEQAAEQAPAADAAAGEASGLGTDAGAELVLACEPELMVGLDEAPGLLSGGLAQLFGTARDWLAALGQTARGGQEAGLHTAKQGGLAAAVTAVDWRLVLSSAAAVVCLAMWMRSRKETALLRAMLRRRDHELSKLVMRVVSLQELLNSGGHLAPISRISRFEGATVTAAFM